MPYTKKISDAPQAASAPPGTFLDTQRAHTQSSQGMASEEGSLKSKSQNHDKLSNSDCLNGIMECFLDFFNFIGKIMASLCGLKDDADTKSPTGGAAAVSDASKPVAAVDSLGYEVGALMTCTSESVVDAILLLNDSSIREKLDLFKRDKNFTSLDADKSLRCIDLFQTEIFQQLSECLYKTISKEQQIPKFEDSVMVFLDEWVNFYTAYFASQGTSELHRQFLANKPSRPQVQPGLSGLGELAKRVCEKAMYETLKSDFTNKSELKTAYPKLWKQIEAFFKP